MSGHIFLYSFVISDEYQVSVSSAFTEKQDMSFIKYYMDEWLRLGGSIPKEFIADMSPALLGAAVHTFGRKSSMVDYMNSLFNLLKGIDDQKPSCFVRIDIAHFIKNVTTCKPLKTARIKHKDFFVRSVALMLKMKSLSEARQHILDVLVVAMSSTEGEKMRKIPLFYRAECSIFRSDVKLSTLLIRQEVQYNNRTKTQLFTVLPEG